ncbi:transcriptional regulator, HxlR family [Halogranum rubrum]|uniref:Transcriptional regulator, HxlR family n=1 Tax=Halogranum rubrum TaxID=553466 RepID=A0A1I4EFW8_9EURY|nr:helix-turn-helix domain-containing protein [Halogranum rubrum]SFL04133.1 transcriptional regulator, HxlR family [Halogranum rubrum]
MTRPDSGSDDAGNPETLLSVTFEGPAPTIDVQDKARLFVQLGRAHTIPILHEFESDPGPRRFSELQETLDVPSTTLTDRLRELTADGFITRQSYDEIPPRVEYTATQKTLDLAPMFEYLCRWGVYYEF